MSDGGRGISMDALRKDIPFTIDDIYAMPDGQRAELIDGRIYMMAPPSTRHQRLLNFITTEINLYIRKNNGTCEVFPAPFAVFLNKDDINYVEPDISVICDADKIDEKGCHGAPDWVIEIVSPSSKSIDYFTKLFKYRASGMKEYWIVDPARESIMVYSFAKEKMEQYSFGAEVPVGIYEGFFITVR